MTQPNQSELREQVLTEFKQVYRLAPADYTENCTNVVMSIVQGYITANYTPNSEVEQLKSQIAYLEGKVEGMREEVAERERVARIDEIRRTRPHLTYPGMVYYGERMNELRSDETEEVWR